MELLLLMLLTGLSDPRQEDSSDVIIIKGSEGRTWKFSIDRTPEKLEL